MNDADIAVAASTATFFALMWSARSRTRARFVTCVWLSLWGAIAITSPLVVLFLVYLPEHQYVTGAAALIVGIIALWWPFLKYGFPALKAGAGKIRE